MATGFFRTRRLFLLSAAGLFLAAACLGSSLLAQQARSANFVENQPPPMGWNSWDRFGAGITEPEARAQAEVMARELRPHGWQYFVVDIQWYEPRAKGFRYRPQAELVMDEWGRLWPATNRFPSAADGHGFKALSGFVHGLGLQFGIHLMRGIPRQAVASNCPIKGTSVRALEIADTNAICAWNGDMYGVDMSKAGAQEYYDSVFALIASWDVDFVKVDDLSRPYHKREIEAISKAISRSGRPMLLSTSPGETPLAEGEHVSEHANMWRISDDFWDHWPELLAQFERLRAWTPYRRPGHFPDADMLPLGVIAMGQRATGFTPEEQFTLMSLWSIARSPLILGADLTRLDDSTRALLTNDEVIAVNQASTGNRQLFRTSDGLIAWAAEAPGGRGQYAALFNTGKESHAVPIRFTQLGLAVPCRVRDLWGQKDLGEFAEEFAPELPPHGGRLYFISKAKR